MIPKSLVLDLKGTLVYASYQMGQGHTIMKRPGLDEFLRKLSKFYEIILFADEETMFTQQIAESIDPNHRIFSARLGRESLCWRKGEFIKDLNYLNRELKNIVVVEKNPKKIAYHPENIIIIPEFKGDKDDRALIELIPFLEHLVRDHVKDVREELEKYGHAETGKKYIDKLKQIKLHLNEQRTKGVGGVFKKMHDASKQGKESINQNSKSSQYSLEPAFYSQDFANTPKPPDL